MNVHKEDVLFTERSVTCSGEPKGVVIHFSGVPTENGVGGTGQTWLDKVTRGWLKQNEEFDVGKNMRKVLANIQGREIPLDDQEFASALENVKKNWNPEIDTMLDAAAVNFVMDMLGKNERTAVSVATKIMGILSLRNDVDFVKPLDHVLMVNVAVTTTDQTAARRKVDAARHKLENKNIPDNELLAMVKRSRKDRLTGDIKKYAKSYRGFNYSAECILKSSHVIINNERERTPEELSAVAYSLLDMISENFPQTAPYLDQYLDV